MNFYKFLTFLGFASFLFGSGDLIAADFDLSNPVSVDSRIKTLVYSDNEIFTVVFNYGYHSYIEFSKGESVKVMAMGDTVNWRVKPVGNKLFIMPLEKSGKTNMMIETTKGRSYAFDLICRTDFEADVDPGKVSKINMDYSVARDLAYIVRFYYPKTKEEFEIEGIRLPNVSMPTKKADGPTKVDNILKANSTRNHYDYVSRDKSVDIVPTELFDDGYLTYFKFSNKGKIPKIFKRDKSGNFIPCKMLALNDYVIIKGVYTNLFLRHDKKYVEIINKSL